MSALALQYVLAALQLLPTLLADVASAKTFIAQVNTDLEQMQATGSDPTPQQWAALNSAMATAITSLTQTLAAQSVQVQPSPPTPAPTA